jgi:hypothetical protein
MAYIYTNFSNFIKEQNYAQPSLIRAKQIIQANQKKGSQYKLPQSFDVFPEVKVFDQSECMALQQCYLNAYQVSLDYENLHLAIGMVIDNEIPDNHMADVTPHAFNIDDKGVVYDYTLGFLEDELDNYPADVIYVGRKVTDGEFSQIEQSTNTGAQIRSFILDEIE